MLRTGQLVNEKEKKEKEIMGEEDNLCSDQRTSTGAASPVSRDSYSGMKIGVEEEAKEDLMDQTIGAPKGDICLGKKSRTTR